MICCCTFYTRNQQPGEMAPEFAATHRKLASRCDFRDLEEMLLNQLVLGLRDEQLLEKFAGHEDLDLKKALAAASVRDHARPRGKSNPNCRAVVHQAATSSASDASDNKEVFKMYQPAHHSARPTTPRSSSNKDDAAPAPCASCRDLYERCSCRFRDTTCGVCGKAGHIAWPCHSRTARGDWPRGDMQHIRRPDYQKKGFTRWTHNEKRY